MCLYIYISITERVSKYFQKLSFNYENNITPLQEFWKIEKFPIILAF